jgi:hypothetical protein
VAEVRALGMHGGDHKSVEFQADERQLEKMQEGHLSEMHKA